MEGHSSSDDATRYRDDEEVASWHERDPILRYRGFLVNRGLVDDAFDKEIRASVKSEVDSAIKVAEASPPPGEDTLFSDVYAELPAHLIEQRDALALEGGGGENEGAFPL